jgi:hypothetical protein
MVVFMRSRARRRGGTSFTPMRSRGIGTCHRAGAPAQPRQGHGHVPVGTGGQRRGHRRGPHNGDGGKRRDALENYLHDVVQTLPRPRRPLDRLDPFAQRLVLRLQSMGEAQHPGHGENRQHDDELGNAHFSLLWWHHVLASHRRGSCSSARTRGGAQLAPSLTTARRRGARP